jgi:predicted kinase
MSKIVLLRGKPTSGKSTAFANIKASGKLKNWVLIDFPKIKDMFSEKDRELRKLALFSMLKEVMKKNKNILLEEMSRETIMKYIGKYVKKYNYKIIVFQFEIILKEAYKRNVQRAKAKWHPYIIKEKLKALHRMHDEKFDKDAVLVDCNKLNKQQVVKLILGKIE